MKNKNILFRIGSKPTSKTRIILTIIISILIGIFMGFALENLIGLNFIIGAGISGVVIFLCYVPLVATINKHWELTEEFLEYHVIDKYLDSLRYVINNLFNREDNYIAKIRLDQIESIKIYWTMHIGILGYIFYPLKLSIKLKDDSIMIMDALLHESEEFYNAFQYMKTKGIKINDKYNLLEAIGNPKVNITDYINEIRKDKVR
ncbi:hypothetical protein HMPREF1092_03018 [Clostridium thermobutyricum]|uniref:Uncharacterized protein n=1 Tax=Clostridium thermobutyricum TaxID=29372 RepID=N9XWA1_9CLOT|nr:hypothetical protein [Clostridium thermobutyricum]ENY99881.1 hypothetical protein HMPREF1092_03018 [Clostridium thermobutyricum]